MQKLHTTTDEQIEKFIEKMAEALENVSIEVVSNYEYNYDYTMEIDKKIRNIESKYDWSIDNDGDVQFDALDSFITQYPTITLTEEQEEVLYNARIIKTIEVIEVFAVSCKCSKFFEQSTKSEQEANNCTCFCRVCGRGNWVNGSYTYEQIYSDDEYDKKVSEGFEADPKIRELFE